MPSTLEILDALSSITNNYVSIAIFWHIVFYALVIALLAGWRPYNQHFILFLALPVLSVGAIAWITGNPFNGGLFSIAFIMIILTGLKASREKLSISALPFMIPGTLLVAFGLWYPHFLIAASWTEYLYSSPAGVIPCPTLSVILGFSLIFNRFNSSSLTILFICFGLFYGIFGVFKLGVYPDIALLAGTICLLILLILKMKKEPSLN